MPNTAWNHTQPWMTHVILPFKCLHCCLTPGCFGDFFCPKHSLCFIFISAVQQRQQNYTLWPVKLSVFFWKWMLNTQLYCWWYELNLSDRVLFIWLWKWTQIKPEGITMLYCTWITLLDSVSFYLSHCRSISFVCMHTHTPLNAQEGSASMNSIV